MLSSRKVTGWPRLQPESVGGGVSLVKRRRGRSALRFRQGSAGQPARAIDAEKGPAVLRFEDRNGAHMESAITTKGQATIPKAVREHLGLKPGDRIKFFLHPDGSVVLLPKLPAMALRGMVKSRRPRPVTIHE